MKAFKVSYKQQSVKSKTKPVQAVLSLNTKYNGGYLYQISSTGISLLPSEWDNSRNLPKNASLASKLMHLQEDILFWMEEFKECSNEQIFHIHQNGVFKGIVEEFINRVVKEVKTESIQLFENIRQTQIQYFKNEIKTRIQFMQEIKMNFLKFNLKVTDQNGLNVSLDSVFNLDESNFNNDPIKPELNLIPATKPPDSASEDNSGQNNPGSMPFYLYIAHVARQKKRRNKLIDARAYSMFSSRFEDFDDRVAVNQVTNTLIVGFLEYIKEKYDLNLSSFNNYKKWIKAVLNYAAYEDFIELNKKLNLKSSLFERTHEKVTMPYLTDEMLDVLYNLKFSDENKHLEYIRDLFYISSYTGGLTFGDLSQAFTIQNKMINGHVIHFISIKRQNTGVNAEIPLMDSVFNILKKYEFKFKPIANAYYNRCIKEVCKQAGFTYDFVQTRTNIQTNQQTTLVLPFYEFISSHTARRSFCTNFYVHRNLNPELIMAFSQHQSLESFLTYIQATEKLKFEEFSKQVIINERNGA